MKKRSLTIYGHRTSISLEEAFWEDLQKIAALQNMSIQKLVESIDELRKKDNLSSNIRVYVLKYYKDQVIASSKKDDLNSETFA